MIVTEDIDTYHANDAASNSKLTKFRKHGPAYYKAAYVDRSLPPEHDTDALKFGRAFDDLMALGSEEWHRRWPTKPPGIDLRKTEGKEWKAALKGQPYLSVDDAMAMQMMSISILAHTQAAELLALSTAQFTVRRELADYGLSLQTRPDFFSEKPCSLSGGKAFTNDIKTTESLSDWFDPYDFESEHLSKPIIKYSYHRQAAIAHRLIHEELGHEPVHFLTVVEKQFPHRCGVVEFLPLWIILGLSDVERDLAALSECFRTDTWPRCPEGVIKAPVPTWLAKREERVAFWHA